MGVFEMKLGSGEIKFGGPSIGGPSVEKNGGPELMKNGGPEAVKKGGPTPK